MGRSFDSRPPLPERVRPALRGAHRIGPIGTIVPGDDVEVAREIERIWLALALLRRGGKQAPAAGGASEWIYVGSGGTAPPFEDGVSNLGGDWAPVRFRMVVVSGKRELETEGVPTGFISGGTIWTLPASHRLPYKKRVTNALASSTGVVVTEYNLNGDVKAYSV